MTPLGEAILRFASVLLLALAITPGREAGASPIPTIGDCNVDGRVSVDELVVGANIALARRDLSDCPPFDANADDAVTVDELVSAVNAALGSPTSTPTHTPTATSTATPTPTATRLPNGATCAAGDACASGNCVDAVCCVADVCPAGQFCAAPDGECEVPSLRMVGPCSELTTCAEGTVVRVSRCSVADARLCASSVALRRELPALLPGTNVVGAGGRFDFEVDATLLEGEEESFPLLTTADLGRDSFGATREMHVMDFGSIFGFAAGRGMGSSPGAGVVETVIDLSSTATVQLLGESADRDLGPIDGEELAGLFGDARETTEGLEQEILQLPPAGEAEMPSFSEASALFVGQVEADPAARDTLGLTTDDYITSRFSLPDGCEEQLGERPELSAQTGRRTSFFFSSSVEAFFDGDFLDEAYVAYVTNLLNGPGGNPVALTCDTRGNVVCGGQVPTGLFRGSTFGIFFPVDGIAVLRVFQIVRPQAGPVQPCDPPDCAIRQCTFNVRVD